MVVNDDGRLGRMIMSAGECWGIDLNKHEMGGLHWSGIPR